MFGCFHSPQTNRPLSHGALNKEWGPLQEKTGSLRHGEAFFLFSSSSSLFWSPSWHRNGLVGRKRESGEKTNDEKVYSPRAFIKYMEGTREAHLDSIGVPLMASSVLFPDQGAGSYGMSMAARTPAIWTHEHPPYTHTHTHTTPTSTIQPTEPTLRWEVTHFTSLILKVFLSSLD